MFTSLPMLEVLHGRQSLGMVDQSLFTTKLDHGGRVISMGGRGWSVQNIDWKERKVEADPEIRARS